MGNGCISPSTVVELPPPRVIPVALVEQKKEVEQKTDVVHYHITIERVDDDDVIMTSEVPNDMIWPHTYPTMRNRALSHVRPPEPLRIQVMKRTHWKHISRLQNDLIAAANADQHYIFSRSLSLGDRPD